MSEDCQPWQSTELTLAEDCVTLQGLRVAGSAVEEGEAGDGLGGRVLEHMQVLTGLRLGVARPHAPEEAAHLESEALVDKAIKMVVWRCSVRCHYK